MIDKATEKALLQKEKKSSLIEEILQLHDDIVYLHQRNNDLMTERDQQQKAAKYKAKVKLKDHCLTISFDPWPLMEWKRLSYSSYNPGKYAQLCVGPLRVDWFAN